MARRAGPLVLVALAIGAVVLARRARNHIAGRQAPGGILIADPGAYDTHSRLLFGSLFAAIASDVAATASPAAKVLEVGCGPGHLSIRVARGHRLDVTGIDLDPAMIERARANAARPPEAEGGPPTFIVGDVAALPFKYSAFDLVVSTFSMHHWSDPAAGLGEIHRVLRPGGRALIWDLKPGFWLFHVHAPDPAELVHASPLRVVSIRPWRWPWLLSFSQRWELARD
jgi:ubiquinone/menaquinone biosynthesis C-methylase UbiE